MTVDRRSDRSSLRHGGVVGALRRLLLVLIFAAALSGCAIRLAPAYDADLLDGITSANQSTLVLFAKLETGSPATAFDTYSDDYAHEIAAFEALRQRAEARPLPPLTQRIAKLKFVPRGCHAGDARDCLDSTGKALDGIVAVLRKMRDQHQSHGLSDDTVQLFRDPYDTEIDQALAVETALKR